MRIAIVSDIHANLQAWKAVLLDIRSSRLDKIVCLGDIVGYGPNPAEVLESVYTNIHNLVLGNHDAVVCGKIDRSQFNEDAMKLLDWTKKRLTSSAIDFLKTLPLTLESHAFRCTHAEFSDPAAFNYIIEPENALPSWKAASDTLMFIGHTHLPAIYVLEKGGKPGMQEVKDFLLERDKRYIINVGSVGQPRDGDPRACYCIFDSANSSITWRRIPFDLDAYRAALKNAEVSEKLSYFLEYDPRVAVPPLRKMLNFTPARSGKAASKSMVEIQHMDDLRRSVSKLRLFAFAAILLALSVSGIFGYFYLEIKRSLVMTLPASSAQVISATDAREEQNIIRMPDAAAAPGAQVPDWNLRIENKTRQSVAVIPTHSRQFDFLIRSDTPRDEVTISSNPILVAPGTRFCMEAQVQKPRGVDASIWAVASVAIANGSSTNWITDFSVLEAKDYKSDGWASIKAVFTVPQNGRLLRLSIRTKFVGTGLVRDLKLYRPKPSQ